MIRGIDDGLGDAVEQQLPVRQPGQAIEKGLMMDFLAMLIDVGDVAAN